MLIPKKDRVAIYEHLFKEGVMVAKKDYSPRAKHSDVDVPNLFVIKALTGLKSKGHVKEQYVWMHFYWYLTNDGIQYLREFLHLPQEIVPATLKRPARTETSRPKPKGFVESDRGTRDELDREGYRRAAHDFDQKPHVPGDQQFTFRQGFGRGAPDQ